MKGRINNHIRWGRGRKASILVPGVMDRRKINKRKLRLKLSFIKRHLKYVNLYLQGTGLSPLRIFFLAHFFSTS